MAPTSEKSIRVSKEQRQESMRSDVTICGRLQCTCSQVMTILANAKTPHFFAYKNFTRTDGPEIPREFMEEYGDEVDSEVYVNAMRVNQWTTFKLEVERSSQVVRLRTGWKFFCNEMGVKQGDMLCFTLEGQSRFYVIKVRGHSYEIDLQFQKERLALGNVVDKGNSNVFFQKDVKGATLLADNKMKGKVSDTETVPREVVVQDTSKEVGSTTGSKRGGSQSLGSNFPTKSFSDFSFSSSGFESYVTELLNAPGTERDEFFRGLWEWMESEKVRLSHQMEKL